MAHKRSEEEIQKEQTFLSAYNKLYGEGELTSLKQLTYITFDMTNMDELIDLCEMYHKTKVENEKEEREL